MARANRKPSELKHDGEYLWPAFRAAVVSRKCPFRAAALMIDTTPAFCTVDTEKFVGDKAISALAKAGYRGSKIVK
jgi:hypothetical protein